VIGHLFYHYPLGGTGPKLIELEQMKEKFQTVIKPDQVNILGPIRADQVRDLMVQGDIFLNASLTEAFGMTLLEAACTGLLVVSTRVGGIPEVLPEELIEFAEPEVDGTFFSKNIYIKSGMYQDLAHENTSKPYSFPILYINQIWFEPLRGPSESFNPEPTIHKRFMKEFEKCTVGRTSRPERSTYIMRLSRSTPYR
jgi:hypothetical protein